ncbi:MAG: hypothetical protein LBN29_03370 [Mediterranea sp.]|jgi:hypothetical protein|nr:hypothetical protein [Mediterranea sp.]
MKKVSASALPTVLVISVLLLVIVLMAFELWNANTFYYIRYHARKQQEMHLTSALTLYRNDSLLAGRLLEGNAYQLYEDDPRSAVILREQPWGLYERVDAANADSTAAASWLVGKARDIPTRPALWICDREHSLTLAGEAGVDGEAYLPKSGLNYGMFHQRPYSGEPLATARIRTAGKELPAIDSAAVRRMDALLSASPREGEPISALSDEGDAPSRRQTSLYGDKVKIPGSWKLTDVLLIARHVTVEAGFSGSMQIVASDTVIIEEGATLRYPSGVYLHGRGGKNKTHLHLCADARLEGYAIVFGDADGSDGFAVDIHYRQEKGSRLSGLLYVDGTAHVEGAVSGAAYLKECYFLTDEEMYAGLLFNARFERSDDRAFPLLFRNGGYQRRVAKRLEPR